MTFTLFLQLFGGLLVVISLIPLIRHDYWTFRVFEFPRAQKLVLILLVLVLYLVTQGIQNVVDGVFAGILFLNVGYLVYQVWPYTPLAAIQLQRSQKPNEDQGVKLLICNVYQHNRKSKSLLTLIKAMNPDVVLLAETDTWWAEQTAVLTKNYPNTVLIPLENTYGMLLYSRLALKKSAVKYLVEPDIPSIHAQVILPSGQAVQLFCLHPTPPVPQENPRSTERDKEILLIGKLSKASQLPVIVAGDLNDVAWSYTSELFQKTSGLLDPRRGRGFFNTFHAKYPLLRFPLDHIFCSTDFKLVRIQRLPHVGSDHFAMFVHLVYDPQAPAQQEEPTATHEETKTAEEKINTPTDDNEPPKPSRSPMKT
ncbi:MAG: endonuclease/exonuclease/phosphatase family protein [Cytophagaceae bacterium]|nr:endonuclease/exonuclease/phosphatase family protein [Cytophagaceae bacterium]